MAGNSFMVTVRAPNAPCTHTHTSVAVASHGLTGTVACNRVARFFQCWTQLATATIKIKTPTPVAR